MHVRLRPAAHPVLVPCRGAKRRTRKHKEEPAPLGYAGENMEEKSSFQRNSYSSPPHARTVSVRWKQVSPNHHPPRTRAGKDGGDGGLAPGPRTAGVAYFNNMPNLRPQPAATLTEVRAQALPPPDPPARDLCSPGNRDLHLPAQGHGTTHPLPREGGNAGISAAQQTHSSGFLCDNRAALTLWGGERRSTRLINQLVYLLYPFGDGALSH